MELNFSFSKPKQERVEKYPTIPVLTYVGGDKTAKFELNKKAVELLGYSGKITAKISFGLTSTNELFLANTTGAETGNQGNITMQNTFASGKLLERIGKFHNLNIVDGAEFQLAEVKEQLQFPILIITGAVIPSTHNCVIVVDDESTVVNDYDEYGVHPEPDHTEYGTPFDEVRTMGNFQQVPSF